ncbi:MAG TPA: hypothetical protein ENN87_16250 [Phycisphaerales bacterium]|nr:hypothetical protein [Phycisphaerales bacterium]
MRNQVLTLCVVALLAGPVLAQGSDLGVTVDATWVSKYIWRGFDMLDDKAALQPSIDLDFWGTGLYFNAWGSWAGSGGSTSFSTVNREEWRFTLGYKGSTMEGDPGQVNYALNWVSYTFPDEPTKARDRQEFNLDLSWPRLLGAGMTPHYQLIYTTPTRGVPIARVVRAKGEPDALMREAGFLHVFGLTYDAPLSGPVQKLSFSADVVYNDGAYGKDVDHDWSHVVWGVAAPMRCPWTGGLFTPALYYQTSMDDSVNKNDEFWTGLSYTYKF